MRWVFGLAVLLSFSSAASQPEPAGQANPVAAQESILPLHDVVFTFGLGVDITPSPDGTSTSNALLGLNIAWSPTEWLEVSFLMPGVSVLLGSRHRDEVVLSGGLDGLGYGSIEGFIYLPSAGAAYRHWFSGATSFGVSARWAGEYSKSLSVEELVGSVFLTHTFGNVVSVNFAFGGAGWPSDFFGLTFGSARPGFRGLPLVQLHLSPVWSIFVDAQLILRLHPEVQTEQRYLLGFTAIW